jgi:hypothetical protein
MTNEEFVRHAYDLAGVKDIHGWIVVQQGSIPPSNSEKARTR